ncbi:MAG TPA: MaoC/PaaZ C-terminal domain-containing protein [Actinotalea sp.]|nr:MaoC/PaaZ C-terminal domain-containing protein [Actinotalea sp.]
MSLAVGQVLGTRTIEVARADLVHYAGASGDRNPIHWNERFAREVGLPGVIAHGMFTMATAVNVVVDALGDPGRVLEYGVRFARPVEVPDPGTATLTVTATVAVVDTEAGTARVDLVVEAAEVKVLAKAQVLVRL